MYPAIISDYHRPTSVQEALSALKQDAGGAMFIAGGQSLMQALKSRLVQVDCLVDLQDVAELKGVKTDGGIKIGAMTRYVDLIDEPSLQPAYAAFSDAAGRVGDRQVRNRGTVGGSVCWNYIAACMPAVALGLGTTMNLMSGSGQTRSVPAHEFLGTPLETDRKPDEILLSLELPRPPKSAGSAYSKWALVTDGLPVVGVCVYVETDGSGGCSRAQVAFGGLASGPKRAPAAEKRLVGCRAGDAQQLQEAMAAGAAELETQSDLWADSGYRKHLMRMMGAEVAATALRRAGGSA